MKHIKCSIFVATLAIVTLLLTPTIVSASHIARPRTHHGHVHHHTHQQSVSQSEGPIFRPNYYKERRAGHMKRKRADTVQIAGSNLPDCSHACASCTPCRLVMVSFVCASLAEAETCPIAYKCMCNNKSYPVP